MNGHEGPFRAYGTERYPQPVNRHPEANRRLDSWKEIAAFLGCGERTVKRWEDERRMPVHRMPGSGRGRVFAYTAELSRWLETGGPDQSPGPVDARPQVVAAPLPARAARPRWAWWVAIPAMLACLVITVLLLGHRPPVPNTHTPNKGAEDLYLQGRFYWNKRTPESLRKAVDYFAQAIVRDPNYARAYVGLADCYNLLREFSVMPDDEAYPKALDAARKALQLDDNLAEAHNSLAFVSFYWNWDPGLADREFRRAIQLNPNYVLAHHWRGTFLMSMGRLPEALDEIEQARKLDPTSNAILADKGLVLMHLRRYDEALALLKQIAAQEPEFSSAHFYLAWTYLHLKDYPAYLAELREAWTLTKSDSGLAVAAAGERGLAAGGGKGMFESILALEKQLYAKGQAGAGELASECFRLGRNAEGLSYLKVSLERREPGLVTIRGDDTLDAVHNDPAYQEILRRVDQGAQR